MLRVVFLMTVVTGVLASGRAATAQDPVPVPAAQNATPDLGPQPEIYSPEPDVDFGEILQGELRQHSFVVGNRGDADLIIRRVNPTCGCTIAQVETPTGELIDPRKLTPAEDILTLKPNQTCNVKAEFNSTGQPTQKLEKTITVISSDNKNPAMRLTMTVTVTKGITVDPNPLNFGDVVRGEARTERTYAKLTKVTDLEIVGWKDKPEYLEATWERTKAPDGTDALAIDVKILPTAPIGYISTALIAETNNDKMTTLPIQIYAQVKSEVVFDTGNAINPERIDFEVIPFGEAREKTLNVKNGNDAIPYRITSLEIDSKYQDKITAQLQEVLPGMQYVVTLKADPTLDARFFRGILKIHADHPDLKLKEIHFHGWVKKDS